MVKLLVEKQILLIKKKQNGWMNLKMHLVCYSVWRTKSIKGLKLISIVTNQLHSNTGEI